MIFSSSQPGSLNKRLRGFQYQLVIYKTKQELQTKNQAISMF